MNEAKKNEPADRIRVGRIEATLWKNASEKGDWYSVTLGRSYEDKDGKWQTTNSFSGTDLLLAAEAMRLAFERSRELQAD